MFDFPWWVWLLIIVTLIVVNIIKFKVFKSMSKKKQKPTIDKED